MVLFDNGLKKILERRTSYKYLITKCILLYILCVVYRKLHDALISHCINVTNHVVFVISSCQGMKLNRKRNLCTIHKDATLQLTLTLYYTFNTPLLYCIRSQPQNNRQTYNFMRPTGYQGFPKLILPGRNAVHLRKYSGHRMSCRIRS